MTVNTQSNKTIADGNGSQTQFAFGFIGVAAAYIGVIFTDAGGNETVLTQGNGATQYQIALNDPVEGALWGVGGTVTYNPNGTPIAAGTTLTMFRTLPLTQAISLQNQISLEALGNGSETGLDTLTMQVQQIAEQQGRAISVPIVDPNPPLSLPPVAQRANMGAAFDGQGNMIAGSTPASGIISSAMQPVVDAATLALGRSAFGLGNIAVENIGASLQDDGAGNLCVNFPVVSVSSDQAPVAANHQTRYMVGSAANFTLPRANTVWSGYEFWVYALTAPVTFTPNANDAIGSLATGVALVIPKGSVCRIHTNGLSSGTWWTDLTPPAVSMPQGYLTLVSGQPVPVGDVSSPTVFYTPFKGQYLPFWTGAAAISFPFSELSLSVASGYTANTAYDLFVTLVNGVPTLVTGPAWRNSGQAVANATNASPIGIAATGHNLLTGDIAVVSNVIGNTAANGIWTVTQFSSSSFTLNGSVGNGAATANTGQFASRGVGVGTSQLTRSAGGFLTNAVAMTGTNGANTYSIPVNQATYVGSILMDATGALVICIRTWKPSAQYGLYNAYNQTPIYVKGGVTLASWTYNSATWRPAHGVAGNSISMFLGLPESTVQCIYKARLDMVDTNGEGNIGIGMDSITAPSGSVGVVGATGSTGANVTVEAKHLSQPFMGVMTITALESAVSGTITFEGTEAFNLFAAQWMG